MYRRTPLNPARMDRDDEKRMLPCRYFMAGFCHKGSRCKFFHPNLHLREPCVRVPDLAPNFSRIPQYGQEFGSGAGSSLLDISPRTNRFRNYNHGNGMISPRTPNHDGSSPPRGKSDSFTAKSVLSPSSHAYSEYLSTMQRPVRDFEDRQYEKQRTSPTRSSNPKPAQDQNTVFNHIDWSEFLVPGVEPPPPTLVPGLGAAMTPVEVETLYRPNATANERALRPVFALSNEDVPPEGSNVSNPKSSEQEAVIAGPSSMLNKKMTAKEELQLKVKQIAQELADEPVQHVRSLDSFFRDYKFNGLNAAGTNLANSTQLEELGEEPEMDDEGNKENAGAGEINVDESHSDEGN